MSRSGLDSGADSAAPLARLDSFAGNGGGRSFGFAGPVCTLETRALDGVIPLLGEVEARVASGLHAVGFMAYEAAPAFDGALAAHTPGPLPLAWFTLFRERVPTRQSLGPGPSGSGAIGPWGATPDRADYTRRVGRIADWIAAGDTYQVNFTFRLEAPFTGDDLALYHALCRSQRADYCALLRLGGVSILSASPELFFRWTGDELEMKPMKGTRPRGRSSAEDRALAAQLPASPKERAENLMIVDLLRNDAGRLAEFGSVSVPRLFEVESYGTVHQMTSTIRARTRPGTTLTDIFRATFPSGSVTGAPKARTSQIIAEIEDTPRGVYTGAIGFVSPGEAVFNVAIRTLVLDRASGIAQLGVGSGITADSSADAEYEECLAKAEFVHDRTIELELLETMLREASGEIFLFEKHLARLTASAQRLGFTCDVAEVRARVAAAAERCGPGRHRLRLRLGRAGDVQIEATPIGPGGDGPRADARLRVAIARAPVNSRDPLLYHKTTHRERYETRAAEHPDCDDVLLVNERGELTESARANVVVELDGARWTPPVEAGLLPGTFREHLLERGEIRERTLRPEDLTRADALYLINSVRRWQEAVLE